MKTFAHLAAGKVSIGVGGIPAASTPSPASLLQDIEILLSKQRAGADFAITQVFFEDERYSALVDSAHLAGVDIPIIPGIMPVTSLKRLQNLCQMAGMSVPADLAYALETATSSAELHRIGVDYALNQCRTVMDAGAPGLHFFTFNEHAAVLDVLDQLDLPRYSNRFSQPLSELGIRLNADPLHPARMRPPKVSPKVPRERPADPWPHRRGRQGPLILPFLSPVKEKIIMSNTAFPAATIVGYPPRGPLP